MNTFLIRTSEEEIRIKGEHLIMNDFNCLEIITDHQCVASFSDWDYWYCEDGDE